MPYKTPQKKVPKQGNPPGYTIVEVMIFLAVSAVLAMSAMRLIGGQQAKTEFNQSVRDLELRLQDLINDVSDGYTLGGDGLACSAGGAAPVVSASGTAEQGTNNQCIVVGHFIGFTEDNGSLMRIYPAVGLRLAQNTNRDVITITEANPVVIGPTETDATIPNRTSTEALLHGARITTLTYNDGASDLPIGAFGFLTDFATIDSGNLTSGSRSVNVYPVPGTASSTPAQVATRVADTDWSLITNNPSVTLCLDSTARTNQHATITIGNQDRQLSTVLRFETGSCT